jgi:hypothetical protein
MRVLLKPMQTADEVRTLWKMTADIQARNLTDEEVMETRRILLQTEDEFKREVQLSLMRQGHVVTRMDDEDVHVFDVGFRHCHHTVDSSRRKMMSSCAWVGAAENIENDDKKPIGFYLMSPDSKRVNVYFHKCPSFGEPDELVADCQGFSLTALIGGRIGNGGKTWDGVESMLDVLKLIMTSTTTSTE